MRYLDIKDFDINNGEGIRVSLWVSGCEFRCRGCHNAHTWDKEVGELFTEETAEYLFELMDKDIPKDLSILGGEPLAEYNRDEILQLCIKFKNRFPNKNIWLWSGYTIEQIKKDFPQILDYIDVLIDGLYFERLRDES